MGWRRGPDDHVEAVAQGPLGLGGGEVEAGDQAFAGRRVGDGAVDGVVGEEGSPGKYIWVTRRWVKERPNTEKWMWAGRQALSLRQG